MSIIYKTTNLQNGKIYVGKAKVNDQNYLGSGVILSQAIEKYGREYFKKEILEECDDNIVDLREIFWIKELNSTDRNIGYNLTKGGTGGDTTSLHPNRVDIINKRGNSIKEWHKSLSESERATRGKKISESKKGKTNGHTGFKHSEESKKLIQENQPKKTDEWKTAHANAMAKRKGKPFTQKYKPVIIDNIEYPSVKHAMESLGIKHRGTFYNRVKRGILKLEYK